MLKSQSQKPVKILKKNRERTSKKTEKQETEDIKKISDKLKTQEPFQNKKISSKLNIFGFFRKRKVDQTEGIPKETIEEKTTPKPKLNIFNFFSKKNGVKEKKIEYFKNKLKEQAKKRAIILERRHRLRFYLERAGLDINPEWLSKRLFDICIFINLVISAFLIYHFSTNFGITWTTILLAIITLWLLVFVVILFVLWILFYIVVDLKIFKRKVDIEDVLADYLQLTASNIKAGMTIDRALWYAVRPRFGVLAKEIEIVAKETMRGEDLKAALQKFADKYDSVLLKRSVSLLIEGLEAGGEIGNILDKIAVNTQENRIMKKEMAADVTTYIIFIAFATIAAAPVLFALSGVLIKVISNLGLELTDVGAASAATGFAISFSGQNIKYSDFRIFAIVSLMITSFFSAAIISTIKSGNIKVGFKYIPVFIFITITLFLIADKILGGLIGVFI